MRSRPRRPLNRLKILPSVFVKDIVIPKIQHQAYYVRQRENWQKVPIVGLNVLQQAFSVVMTTYLILCVLRKSAIIYDFKCKLPYLNIDYLKFWIVTCNMKLHILIITFLKKYIKFKYSFKSWRPCKYCISSRY
jgi:hypothetical protein